MKANTKFSVDRIEENVAICQDLCTENMISISLSLLPKEVKEGDIIIKQSESSFLIDKEETLKRRKEILNLQNRIFKKINCQNKNE